MWFRERKAEPIVGEEYEAAKRAVLERLKFSGEPIGDLDLREVVKETTGRKKISYGQVQSLIRRIRRNGLEIKGTTGTGGGYEWGYEQLELIGSFDET